MVILIIGGIYYLESQKISPPDYDELDIEVIEGTVEVDQDKQAESDEEIIVTELVDKVVIKGLAE